MLGLTLPDLRQPRVWMAGLATSYGWTAIIALMSLAAGRIALDMQTAQAMAARRAGACRRRHRAGRERTRGRGCSADCHPARGAASRNGRCILDRSPAAACLRDARRRTAERGAAAIFAVDPAAVVALAASGGALAVIQLRQFDALWTTDYGLVLCAKLVAVAVLIALAAVNRYALTPRVVAGDADARAAAGPVDRNSSLPSLLSCSASLRAGASRRRHAR